MADHATDTDTDTDTATINIEKEILAGLRQSSQDVRDAETREARLTERAEEYGIPYSHSELAQISGAGEARHRRRTYALATAAMSYGGSLDGAAIILLAYRIGQGGGLQNPGEGTHRAVDVEVLTDWQNLLRVNFIPYGGGFTRRNAIGGDAWTAAAKAAAELIAPNFTEEWFHGRDNKWTLLERFRSTIVWEKIWPASDAVRRMVLAELVKKA
jgi:hypothetical protein